jgi:competence CoiA-like predicted nuclease
MPCCDSDAVPKTSPRGNHFFAHKNRGACTTAPESHEHIYLKTLVARAARTAGWQVTTEWPGETPEGARWVADVYCQKGRARIAVEIQLAYQVEEEFQRRQRAYAESGVRSAWLLSAERFKGRQVPPSRDLPTFSVKSAKGSGEPEMQYFDATVSEFTVALLTKRVVWQQIEETYALLSIQDNCWKCNAEVKQLYGYSIEVHERVAMTVPHASTTLEALSEMVDNAQLNALGINSIGRVDRIRGKTTKFPFCNLCLHCGAPQSNYYLLERLHDAEYQKMADPLTIVRAGAGRWVLL